MKVQNFQELFVQRNKNAHSDMLILIHITTLHIFTNGPSQPIKTQDKPQTLLLFH